MVMVVWAGTGATPASFRFRERLVALRPLRRGWLAAAWRLWAASSRGLGT